MARVLLSLVVVVVMIVASRAQAQVVPSAPAITVVGLDVSSSHEGDNNKWKIVDGNLESDWRTNFYDTAPVITFYFDQVYTLECMEVWNYWNAEYGRCGDGIKDVKIYISTDGITFDETPLGITQFARSGPSNNIHSWAYDQVSSEWFDLGVDAMAVKFVSESNYWGSVTGPGKTRDDLIADGMTGLNEVTFFGRPVPEPATMSLLAMGGLALLRRKRRATACTVARASRPRVARASCPR